MDLQRNYETKVEKIKFIFSVRIIFLKGSFNPMKRTGK